MKIQFKKLAVALIAAMVVSGGMVFGADEVGKKPSDYLTLKIDSNPKTGGFVGGEFGLTIGDWYSSYNYVEPKNTGTVIENPPGFAINVVGGYQWYFYNKPYFHLGVRAKGWLGYGYQTYKYKNNYENYYQGFNHTFNFGSDVAFLWDFVNVDKHSFGVHFAPIGFNVSFDNGVSDETKRGDGGSELRKGMKNSDVYGSYTINLGLHYYYNVNHQFSVDYRHFANSFTANFQILLRHQFSVGYAYKF